MRLPELKPFIRMDCAKKPIDATISYQIDVIFTGF